MDFLKNWKTTAAGLGAVLIPVINSIIPVLPPQYATIAGGVAAGLGLIFAKDRNVTGGSVRQ